MGKFSRFIVSKRYYILGVMLLLFVGSLFLIPKVRINRDMTQYLPKNSEIRKGLDVMDEQFPDSQLLGQIRVMFRDLPAEDVPAARDALKGIPGVTQVEHDDGPDYNQPPYTLFTLSCAYAYNTPEERAVEKAVADAFEDRSVVVQHTESSLTQIPIVVYAVVVVVLVIILFVMSSSYVGPLLFLATIGIAIAINLGTNACFRHVSESTHTLSAILQLALSMDYSVILMNRYHQERAKAKTAPEAMTRAFQAALPSIMASGLTTVIGLLMLVFMRFRIGLDLGRALAKGVALSMICVLTVLPPLIILFDKAITKTRKRELPIATGFLASFGFRARKVLAVLFVLLFIGAALMQGLITLTFDQPKSGVIEDVFPSPNIMVVLYPNGNEERLAPLVAEMEGKEGVNRVVGYGNTVGKPLTSAEMADAVAELSPGAASLNPTVLRVLYHHHAGKDQALPSLTPEQFVGFLTGTMMEDESFAPLFDDETKENLNTLSRYVEPAYLNQQRTAAELAGIAARDEEEMRLLLTYAYGERDDFVPSDMTLPALIAFINRKVADNPAFQDLIDQETAGQLAAVQQLLDKDRITMALPSFSIWAALKNDLPIPQETVEHVFQLKGAEEMSLIEFTDAALSEQALADPTIAEGLGEGTIAKLRPLQAIMHAVAEEQALSADEAADLLSQPADMMRMLYLYRTAVEEPERLTLSVREFLDCAADLAADPPPFGDFDLGDEDELTALRGIADAASDGTALTAGGMSDLFGGLPEGSGFSKDRMELVYLCYAALHDADGLTRTLSIESFLHYLVTDVIPDERFGTFLDDETRSLIDDADRQLGDAVRRLKGPEYSLLLLDTSLPAESKETSAFVHDLQDRFAETLSGKVCLIGNSPMNVEMEDHFRTDWILITVLTAVAIFLVVALTFRSVSIPLILVLLVQCAVHITSGIVGLAGRRVYYLSLLIVQCILMGATIDYGIVLSNYYVESRRKHGIREALTRTFKKSIHTVLTSGLIIILITGIVGIGPSDPAITEICQTISLGALIAVLLILLVLPGLLAAFDRAVTRSDRKRTAKALAAGAGGASDPPAAEPEEQGASDPPAAEPEEQDASDPPAAEPRDSGNR